jgi:heme exporter protein D
MIDLGPHAVFIIWAYGGTALAVAGLVGWTVFDARRTASRLAELNTRSTSK